MTELFEREKTNFLIKHGLKQLGLGFVFLIIVWVFALLHSKHHAFTLINWVNVHRDQPMLFWVEGFWLFFAASNIYKTNQFYSTNKKTQDEAKKQQTLIDNNAKFAERIGHGDYGFEFKPASEEDILGKALLEMRGGLVEASKKEEERNWIVFGTTEIGDILRKNTELKKLSEEVIAFLCWKINAVQGAFYILNDEHEGDVFLEMSGSFAYNKKK